MNRAQDRFDVGRAGSRQVSVQPGPQAQLSELRKKLNTESREASKMCKVQSEESTCDSDGSLLCLLLRDTGYHEAEESARELQSVSFCRWSACSSAWTQPTARPRPQAFGGSYCGGSFDLLCTALQNAGISSAHLSASCAGRHTKIGQCRLANGISFSFSGQGQGSD